MQSVAHAPLLESEEAGFSPVSPFLIVPYWVSWFIPVLYFSITFFWHWLHVHHLKVLAYVDSLFLSCYIPLIPFLVSLVPPASKWYASCWCSNIEPASVMHQLENIWTSRVVTGLRLDCKPIQLNIALKLKLPIRYKGPILHSSVENILEIFLIEPSNSQNI